MTLRDFKVFPFDIQFILVQVIPATAMTDTVEQLEAHTECWEKAFNEYKEMMAAVKLKADYLSHTDKNTSLYCEPP